jgi:Sigma-70, region 4
VNSSDTSVLPGGAAETEPGDRGVEPSLAGAGECPEQLCGTEPAGFDEVGSRLALLSALQFARMADVPSTWSYKDWLYLTRHLDPRERIVVAMHAIRGLGFEVIGAWFGFGRHRADQLWRRALVKMREDETALDAVA